MITTMVDVNGDIEKARRRMRKARKARKARRTMRILGRKVWK